VIELQQGFHTSKFFPASSLSFIRAPFWCVVGRVQGQWGSAEGEQDDLHFRCSTAVLSPRVGARKRAEGSHPQWIFRTRCSSVLTAEVTSFSLPGNSFSFTISSSRTNPSVARIARTSG
jgi:hypothetical protein